MSATMSEKPWERVIGTFKAMELLRWVLFLEYFKKDIENSYTY